jgi:hypothetical protein
MPLYRCITDLSSSHFKLDFDAPFIRLDEDVAELYLVSNSFEAWIRSTTGKSKGREEQRQRKAKARKSKGREEQGQGKAKARKSKSRERMGQHHGEPLQEQKADA